MEVKIFLFFFLTQKIYWLTWQHIQQCCTLLAVSQIFDEEREHVAAKVFPRIFPFLFSYFEFFFSLVSVFFCILNSFWIAVCARLRGLPKLRFFCWMFIAVGEYTMQTWNSIRIQILSFCRYTLLYISFEWENECIVNSIPFVVRATQHKGCNKIWWIFCGYDKNLWSFDNMENAA